ncbi:MAG: ABC transporter ATP-binding protein [Lachnospiraceae bacterium]|nr:ABC transporter ATP-binding protein [Lachnospiraceae bacterium]
MNNRTIRWLYTVSGRTKWNILFLIIVEALHGASGVFYALLLRNIVDAAIASDIQLFRRNALLIILLVAAQLMLRAVLRFLNELTRSTLENRFKKRLFHTLLIKDYAAVTAIHSGEWMNRLTNDAQLVANSCVEILPGLFGMAVKLISAFVMMIILDPKFAALLLPAGLILGGFSLLLRRHVKRLHKNVQEKDGKLRIFLQERLSSLLILRAFSAREQTEAEAQERMQVHKAARMRQNRFSNMGNVGLGIAVQGMYLFAVIWCGYGILTKRITYGTLTAMTQLITQIQAPFANITGYLPRWYAMLASAERLMEAESFEEELSEEPDSFAEVTRYYHENFASLCAKHVSFSYPDPDRERNADVLRDLSVSIQKGEILALTGQSGCGKSTFLKLLLSIYRPQEGELLLENRDGSLTELSPRQRRLFAYVPQGNQLLQGTIRDAVSFSDPAAASDEARLWEALKLACAEDFVRTLENGPDTLLGERGAGLSEGQLQRLAIARAVFAGSPILLLDEATASLDGETEKRLLENLRKLTDKTVLIVTHRPAALSICDRVLHFSEQGIAER